MQTHFLQSALNSNSTAERVLKFGYHITTCLGITAYVYHSSEPIGSWYNKQRRQRGRNSRQQDTQRCPEGDSQLHISHVYFSRSLRLYSLVILLIVAIAIPFVAYSMYLNQLFLRNSRVLSLVGFGRLTFLHICAFGTLLRQYCKQQELITCTNRMLRLQLSISKLVQQLGREILVGLRPHYDDQLTFMLCLMLVPLLLSPTWTIFIVRIENVLERPAYLACLLILYYCQLVLQLTLCNCFVCTLILAQQSNKLNILLSAVLHQVARHSTKPQPLNFATRLQFNTLTSTIKKLQRLFEENSQINGLLFRIYGPQLVAFLSFVLTECTVQSFVLYFVSCSPHAALPYRYLGDVCEIRWNPWAMVYAFGLISNMCLVVGAAHQLQSRVQYTRIVLAEGSARIPHSEAQLSRASFKISANDQIEKVLRESVKLQLPTRKKPQISTLQARFMHQLEIVIYYMTTLMGITTYVYASRRKQRAQRHTQPYALRLHKQHKRISLRSSHILKCYSFALLILMNASIPFVLYTLYVDMRFLSQTRLLAIVGNMRYVLIQGSAILIMFINCCRQRRLLRFLNRSLRMQSHLLELTRYLRQISDAATADLLSFDRTSCVLLCTKVLSTMLPLIWTAYVIHKEHALQRPRLLASLLFNSYCTVFLQLMVVLYYICVLRVHQYGKALNLLLQNAIAEARGHLDAAHRPLNVIQRKRMFCLCRVIRRLHCLYKSNALSVRELVQIFTPSLLCFSFVVVVLCTVQLFVFYFLTCSYKAGKFRTDGNITHRDSCSTPNFVGVIQVLTMFGGMCAVIWGTYFLQSSLSETRLILAETSIELPLPRDLCGRHCCEVQLEAVLSDFALYLRMEYQQQPKKGRRYVHFMICGLFAFERRLLFVILQTILNYLLILIQYDKITK